ncbi:MAG: sigma-70 family RNA polymerase sigma factor [Planctomycetota bacterium]
MRRVLARDPAAVELFLERTRRIDSFVAAASLRRGRALDEHTLRDIAQDVFVGVWSNLTSYRGEAGLLTWVYRFCELRVHNALRRSAVRRLQALPDALVDPSPLVGEQADTAEVVDQALGVLEPLDATILRLKVFEARSFEDIGGQTSGLASTVKSRYYRALARLRSAPICLTRSLRHAV